MKNILLLIHDDRGQEARLQAALELARVTNGHLIGVCAAEPPFVVDGHYYGATGAAVLISDAAEKEALENRARITERLASEDVPWSIIDVTGSLADALVTNASLADLIVLNAGLSKGTETDMATLTASMLMETRKPILGVPHKGLRFDPLAEAVVAWDGSKPATAAMRAAVPLLRLAANVTLLEIVNGRSGAAAEEAASYLSRYGVRPEIVRYDGDGAPVATMILSECHRRSAYCVMGAFSRSRLSEALFGGVSRRMLAETSVPLFMAH